MVQDKKRKRGNRKSNKKSKKGKKKETDQQREKRLAKEAEAKQKEEARQKLKDEKRTLSDANKVPYSYLCGTQIILVPPQAIKALNDKIQDASQKESRVGNLQLPQQLRLVGCGS